MKGCEALHLCHLTPSSEVSPKRSTEDHPEGSCISEAPGSCHKKPERQSAITYDYSEEELMASIEREYCC